MIMNRKLTKVETKILSILDSQFHKGMKTYGETLDDARDMEYEWNIMALEELIDALSYQVKENFRLENENRKLRLSLQETNQ